jgi:hypothetical protein
MIVSQRDVIIRSIRSAVEVAIVVVIGLTTMPTSRAETSYYPLLSTQVDLSQFPADFVRTPEDAASVGERIRVKEFLYEEIEDLATGDDVGAKMIMDLVVTETNDAGEDLGLLELEVPGLEDVLSLVVGEGPFHAEATLREDVCPGGHPFSLVIVPGDDQITFRFKTDVLKPVKPGTFEEDPDKTPQLELPGGVEVVIRYSCDGDPDFQIVQGFSRPTLSLTSSPGGEATPVMIGDSGIVLEVQDAEIDFSRTSSPSLPAGQPPLPGSWVGIKFHRLAIHFTNGLDVPTVEHGAGAPPPPSGITVSDFFVGSGGVSGGISGHWSTPSRPNFPLFGSSFALTDLAVTLEQGSLTSGEVKGEITEFPYFEVPVAVSLALALDGNFKVGLESAVPGNPISLDLQNLMTFNLEAFSIERKADLYVWKMSGSADIPELPATVGVDGLSITSAGDVTLDGGWLVLPKKIEAGFQGYGVELWEAGFGTELPGSRRWVGFSGGIQLSAGFDAAARFKKMQFFLGPDGNVDVRVAGVEISFRRPGVISFTGALEYFDDPASNSEGFAGAVACNLEAIKLAISARLVVGTAKPPGAAEFPIFYVDFAASFPAGSPVWANFSVYGVLGTMTYGTAPNIAVFTTPLQWFDAHSRAINPLDAVPPYPHAPWKVLRGAWAMGGGVIAGTTADAGYAVSAKISILIASPGPTVALLGQGNITEKLGELVSGADPKFTLVAVFDGNQNTFRVNLGAYFTVENVLTVAGEAEAFFNLSDPNDWHLWLGKDQPEERRIQAEVLGFLKGSSYFMIDPASFRNGARAGYEKTWKFGKLRVSLAALIGYDMNLFYRPFHIWGQAQLKGHAELRACGVGIGVSTNATLATESNKPLLIDGRFGVRLKLTWPLPSPRATVKVRWEKQAPKEPLDELVNSLAVEPRKQPLTIAPQTVSLSVSEPGEPLPPPSSILSDELCSPGESVPESGQTTIACTKPLVPQDVLLVAAFQRNTNDIGNLGYGNPYDSANPRVDLVKSTRFQYNLNAVELVQAHKGATTLNFDTPLTNLYGAWPALAGGENPSALYFKLLSRNPLDVYQASTYLFYEDDTKGWTEWALATYGGQYCERKEPLCDITSLEDFVLPPYSAFRFTVDSDVARNEGGPDRNYRNTAIFHTEGPPLDLEPYVETTVPPDNSRPHYIEMDVGIRFNDSYLDLLYRQPGQALLLQILDDNDKPLGAAAAEVEIRTDWDEAPDHVPRPTEDDWLQFLRDQGVAVDTMVPRDDRVFGRVSQTEAIRPNERHRVRVWLEDPRLATDERLSDPDWLTANPVRFHENTRAVVHEFPVLYSRFLNFTALID